MQSILLKLFSLSILLLNKILQDNKQMAILGALNWQSWGALEYEGDGNVPTGERKQGAFERGPLGVGSNKIGPFLV